MLPKLDCSASVSRELLSCLCDLHGIVQTFPQSEFMVTFSWRVSDDWSGTSSFTAEVSWVASVGLTGCLPDLQGILKMLSQSEGSRTVSLDRSGESNFTVRFSFSAPVGLICCLSGLHWIL